MYSKIKWFFLVLIFVSCSKEESLLEENELLEKQSIDEDDKEQRMANPLGFYQNSKYDKLNRALEDRMQWVSFLSAKALAFPEARQEVLSLMGQENKISIDLLLGEFSQAPIFKQKFTQALQIYLNPNGITPDFEVNKPGRLTTGFGIGLTGSDLVEFMSREEKIFFHNVLNEQCLELYFPLGYQNIIGLPVTVGHPLNNVGVNDGIVFLGQLYNPPNSPPWHPETITMREDLDAYAIQNAFQFSSGTLAPPLVIDDYYVILTRPVRTADCPYNEYPNIDFTQFLNLNN